MPEVVAEGAGALSTNSAALILVKTVYTAALALYCIIAPPYPFIPVQMSLLSFCNRCTIVCAGMSKSRPRKRQLLDQHLLGVTTCFYCSNCTLALLMTAGHLFKLDLSQVSTMALITTTAVRFALLRRISLPLTKLRVALLVVCIAIVVGSQ